MATERAGGPHQVFERYLDAITAQQWDELPALYAHDAVVEHPHGPADHRILSGRDELRTHFDALRDMGLQLQAGDVLVHDTLDPEVIIAEFIFPRHNEHAPARPATQHLRDHRSRRSYRQLPRLPRRRVTRCSPPHDGQASNKGHRQPFRDDDCGHGL